MTVCALEVKNRNHDMLKLKEPETTGRKKKTRKGKKGNEREGNEGKRGKERKEEHKVE